MARPRTDIAPRIVRAARGRFVEHGVEGAPLRGIAKDAGTSIGMIYYYFPTKDDLFFAVVEEAYERLLVSLEHALAPPGTVEERLLRLFERIASLTDEEVETLKLVVREALVSSARLDRLVARFMRGHIPLLVRTLSEGIADGTLDRARHPFVLLLSTFGLAGPPQLIRRTLGPKVPAAAGVPGGKAHAGEMLDILLHGVSGRRAVPAHPVE
jgi:AcrR family transcriptional regulator